MPSLQRKTAVFSAAAITKSVEKWFRAVRRDLPWRASADPYLVWVSEIMLQQTRVDVVIPYFERFVARFPAVSDLAAAPLDDVLALWSGLGYYRRARMMHEAAQQIVGLGGFPRDLDSLRKIRGIGRYTAGAIASIAFGERAAIVDGNVARVLSRLFAIEDVAKSRESERKLWAAAEELVDACASPRDFNQGLMELGALVCSVTKPLCAECPLESSCVAHARGVEETLPRRAEKRDVVRMEIPLYVVRDRGGRILFRVERGDLMTGMFHLPHGTSDLLSSDDRFVEGEMLGEFTHTVTHRRISFVVKSAELRDSVRESRDDYRWLAPRDLTSVPHPSYVAKALRIAKV